MGGVLVVDGFPQRGPGFAKKIDLDHRKKREGEAGDRQSWPDDEIAWTTTFEREAMVGKRRRDLVMKGRLRFAGEEQVRIDIPRKESLQTQGSEESAMMYRVGNAVLLEYGDGEQQHVDE